MHIYENLLIILIFNIYIIKQEQEREAVRDWILQVSLDQKVNQEIDKRLCDECNAEIYSAALECFNCHTKYEPCIITGNRKFI